MTHTETHSLKTCFTCKEEKPTTEFGRHCQRSDGLRGTCKPCMKLARKAQYVRNRAGHIASVKKWQAKNPMHAMLYERNRWRSLREQVLAGYGNVCTCCGEQIQEFLTVEHLKLDGKAHRLQVNGTKGVYLDILRRGFPPQYTILCMNCNFAKRKGGPCPHEGIRAALALAKGE